MSQVGPTRVCGVQMNPRLAAPGANADHICEQLSAAGADGARLVVFPEAALTGYVFDSADEAVAGAVGRDSEHLRRIGRASGEAGVWTVFGAIEREPGEPRRLYNTAYLCHPDGRIERYRKVHTLCLGVDRFTSPGREGFRVFDTPIGRLGLAICYDGSFPETARVLKLLGAQLIVLPTNWPNLHLKTELVRLRALENHVFFLAVNRVGIERGVSFPGGSIAAGPRGELLARAAGEPGRFLVEIEPEQADRNRVVERPGAYEFDYVRDRRPDAYAPLVDPTGADGASAAGARVRRESRDSS